ncbi:hypothetical protein [Patulibacter sp.]|uniref:hypothetical protein n=1 Tax=Patulibacter sp. TaxID=1912859 RepID=UPI00271DD396|nr:hypothetical protein [Patulibacter sp.]MDO9410780.1 hypothetical protein [Patulibacter sp.]
MRRTRLVALLAACVGAVTAAPAAAAPATFDTAFVDSSALSGPDRDTWVGRAASVGASRLRLAFSWGSVAPSAPPADVAGSAAWAGYRFDNLDAQVRSTTARGLAPMLSVTGAPAWATEPGRPKGVNASAWKPDVAAFGAFMRALAERYSGRFPDPQQPGATLPRVAQFQVWNEPNLRLYLAPQYENGKPFAPTRFRELVNAGYAGVKSVQPDATVVAAGLAPYGDPGTNPMRTRPALFLRTMLCLDERLDKTCGDVTSVDALAIHPYTVNKPSQPARDSDDITIPDVSRLQTLILAAQRAGTVGPKRPELWVTELHWETAPDPDGISFDTRARYISEAFWRLWRVGVPVVYWYLMRDDAYTKGEQFFDSYQSGIFYRSGRRKADARAFRFPLLVTGRSAKRMNVWFRTPSAGTTTIQVRRNGRWVSVVRKRGLPLNGVATVKVPRAGVTGVRGIAGKATSYVWDVS